MSKLELKINETAVTDSQPPVVEVIQAPFKQRITSNWHIVPNGKGIIATSNMGDRFEGSVKDFNKAMKVQ